MKRIHGKVILCLWFFGTSMALSADTPPERQAPISRFATVMQTYYNFRENLSKPVLKVGPCVLDRGLLSVYTFGGIAFLAHILDSNIEGRADWIGYHLSRESTYSQDFIESEKREIARLTSLSHRYRLAGSLSTLSGTGLLYLTPGHILLKCIASAALGAGSFWMFLMTGR